MMKRSIYIIFAAVALFVVSCIKNDIPYPYQPLYITNIEGEGFTTSIDGVNRVVTLNLEETTDLRNVTIDSATCTEEAKLDREIVGTFDFTTPLSVTLYNYQSYAWTIQASQTITRTMKVVGQIGDAVIDPDELTVRITISDNVDPSLVSVTELKLGPESITQMTPSASELTNFESVRQVYVNYHDREEVWRIYATFEQASVNMSFCTLLATRAWVETTGDTSTGEECGYKYRKVGEVNWTTFTVTPESGFFEAEITGLTPETDYEIKSYIGDMESPTQTHTTESTPQLSNSDFEEWHTDNWVRPYLYGDSDPVWDSGNQGANTIGASLTESDATTTRPGTEGQFSARLTAKNILKFAAGNLFVGSYAGTIGTDGIISFGYPFTQRPVALRGWYKYDCGVMNFKGSNLPIDVSESITTGVTPDIGTVYIALGTWTPTAYSSAYPANEKSPKYVYTGDVSTFFDPQGEDVVAYGSLQKSESVSEWTQFEIPLTYYDRETLPTHIIIVASTSLYGDYFTGSSASEMWIDDFELVYE